MLDNFIYEDHHGRRFVGLDNKVFANYNDLRDYSWSYDTINNRIARFYRGIAEKKIPLVVCGLTESRAISAMNLLHEYAETDIAAKLPGKIYVGDWYTIGYIVGSEKTDYLITKRLCKLNLSYVSDDPAWYKEKTHVFAAGTEGAIGTDSGKDYPYEFPFDYVASQTGRSIVCDSIAGNEFRMRIYGTAVDPTITIGGHEYKVEGDIAPGESLLIDSITKTITLTKANGTKENWFDNRSRENYIFQQLPSGQSTVIWNGSFGFDLTVIEKRSEPKWT